MGQMKNFPVMKFLGSVELLPRDNFIREVSSCVSKEEKRVFSDPEASIRDVTSTRPGYPIKRNIDLTNFVSPIIFVHINV